MSVNRKQGFNGGPILNPPEGIDPMNPDWSDPRMKEWLEKYLPNGSSSSIQNPKK